MNAGDLVRHDGAEYLIVSTNPNTNYAVLTNGHYYMVRNMDALTRIKTLNDQELIEFLGKLDAYCMDHASRDATGNVRDAILQKKRREQQKKRREQQERRREQQKRRREQQQEQGEQQYFERKLDIINRYEYYDFHKKTEIEVDAGSYRVRGLDALHEDGFRIEESDDHVLTIHLPEKWTYLPEFSSHTIIYDGNLVPRYSVFIKRDFWDRKFEINKMTGQRHRDIPTKGEYELIKSQIYGRILIPDFISWYIKTIKHITKTVTNQMFRETQHEIGSMDIEELVKLYSQFRKQDR